MYNDISQSEQNGRRYTVQRTNSSISNGTSKAENSRCYAVFRCIIKWLTAVFLCVVVSCCIVASKICWLVLGQHYRSINRTGSKTAETETSKQALFMMLLLTLMVPHVVSFIYASWTSLRRKSRPWPTKLGLVLVSMIALQI